MTDIWITIRPKAGESIFSTAKMAIATAKVHHMEVRFAFNDTELIVREDDTTEILAQDYEAIRRQDQRRRGII